MGKEGSIHPGIQKLWVTGLFVLGFIWTLASLYFSCSTESFQSANKCATISPTFTKVLPWPTSHPVSVWLLCSYSEENSRVFYTHGLYLLFSHFLSHQALCPVCTLKTHLFPLLPNPMLSWLTVLIDRDCNCQGWSHSGSYWNPFFSRLHSPDLSLTSLAFLS